MTAVPLEGRTVVIVEQWPMLRIGVARVCQSAGMRVIDSSDDAFRGLASARNEGADVLIVGRTGSAVAPLVRQAKSSPGATAVAVLVQLGSAGSEELADLLAAGSDALLVESSTPDDLLAALGQLLVGERVVAPSLIPALVGLRHREPGAEPGKPERPDGLTDRQREILARLADGLSNAEIGEALYISAHTVRTHLAQIYDRLGVGNRRDALARAIALGVLG